MTYRVLSGNRLTGTVQPVRRRVIPWGSRRRIIVEGPGLNKPLEGVPP
jgi:hypothetical protein